MSNINSSSQQPLYLDDTVGSQRIQNNFILFMFGQFFFPSDEIILNFFALSYFIMFLFVFSIRCFLCIFVSFVCKVKTFAAMHLLSQFCSVTFVRFVFIFIAKDRVQPIWRIGIKVKSSLCLTFRRSIFYSALPIHVASALCRKFSIREERKWNKNDSFCAPKKGLLSCVKSLCGTFACFICQNFAYHIGKNPMSNEELRTAKIIPKISPHTNK